MRITCCSRLRGDVGERFVCEKCTRRLKRCSIKEDRLWGIVETGGLQNPRKSRAKMYCLTISERVLVEFLFSPYIDLRVLIESL